MRTWSAPAKINLFLHVLGRRKDQLHQLQTVFQLLDYGDILRFHVRGDGVIRRLGSNDGLPVEDLTIKAARFLKETAGIGMGVDIELVKNIPIGAGLGGGSSNAATTLVALNQLWGLNFGSEKLSGLGYELGADIPVFIKGHSAYGEGTGATLSSLDLPPRCYCIVVPPVQVLTRDIYEDPQLTRDTPRRTIKSLMAGDTRNDLEAVTCQRYPVVGNSLQWLRSFGDARMTGSGSALFVEVLDEEQGREILAKAPNGCVGFVANGVNHHRFKL